MGEALGRSLRAGGARVIWVSNDRSPATAARAAAAAFDDVGDVSAVVDADVVVSICPPDVATTVAESVASTGFVGVYLDANAIAPATAASVADTVTAAGSTYCDGGVIGGPAAPRLFLSGAPASSLGPLFGPPVMVEVLSGANSSTYAASSLKMVYAGWTKGTTALLLALAATAEQLGVADELRAEWKRSQPDLLRRLEGASRSSAKAWRWSGEMHEIAVTLAAAGLPSGFHEGAAEVYDRLAALKDDPSAMIAEVLEILTATS
jgi:hypothetical protein